MADAANKYAENVPGKFYVDDQCIDCDLCRETAPANFKRNDDGGHSYVYKQPETPDEEGLCKEAMEGCPVEAIGNDGAEMVGREKASPDRTRAHRKRATSKQDVPRRIQIVPVGLSIAGSDSSAGAGIQADLKTFSALGVYGLTAVTCIVAEIPGKVSRIEPVRAKIVRNQIEVLAKNFQIAAIKTGLLCSAEIISAVAK